jgi:hypothetical protein
VVREVDDKAFAVAIVPTSPVTRSMKPLMVLPRNLLKPLKTTVLSFHSSIWTIASSASRPMKQPTKTDYDAAMF